MNFKPRRTFPVRGRVRTQFRGLFLINPEVLDSVAESIWKIKVPERVKVFLLLMSKNRLLIAYNLAKRNWLHISSCVMCRQSLLELVVIYFANARSIMRDLWMRLGQQSHLNSNISFKYFSFYFLIKD
jgi:zinc-binding in reverse transcriptase